MTMSDLDLLGNDMNAPKIPDRPGFIIIGKDKYGEPIWKHLPGRSNLLLRIQTVMREEGASEDEIALAIAEEKARMGVKVGELKKVANRVMERNGEAFKKAAAGMLPSYDWEGVEKKVAAFMNEKGVALTEQEANAVWDILVDKVGAAQHPRERDQFVHYITDENGNLNNRGRWPMYEYRFQGKLGYGGKFHVSGGRWTVGMYAEDVTLERDDMRRAANAQLEALQRRFGYDVK